MARRNPGGHGQRKGEDHGVGRAESEFIRETLQPAEDGWFISPTGNDITPSLTTTAPTLNNFRLTYMPPRTQSILVSQARVSVTTLQINSSLKTALYVYENQVYRRIPGTACNFPTTATGLITVQLPDPVLITPNMRLFMGLVTHGIAATVAGTTGGIAGATRPLNTRTLAGHTDAPRGQYLLSELTLSTSNTFHAFVPYLSKEAAFVL